MQLKPLGLTAGAILMVLVGIYAYQYLGSTFERNDRRVGQSIAARIDLDAIHQIRLTDQDRVVTLQRNPETNGWMVLEQAEMDADQWKINTLLADLQTRQVSHQVSTNPERLAELQLLLPGEEEQDSHASQPDQKPTATAQPSSASQPPANKGSESIGKRLELLDAEKRHLLDLVLGVDRTRTAQNSLPQFGGHYVRFAAEPHSFLIGDSIPLEFEAKHWIQTTVFSEQMKTRIKVVSIRPRSKTGVKQPSIQITREEEENAAWALKNNGPDKTNVKALAALIDQIVNLEINHINTKGSVWRSQTTQNIILTDVDEVRYYLLFSNRKDSDNYYHARFYAQAPADASETAQSRAAQFTARYKDRLLAFDNWIVEPLLKSKKAYLSGK